jgi:dihydrofolate reductase
MRKLIISEHISIDGYVGGVNGQMDWIKLDEELFNLVGEFTNEADTALYGRKTYEMMESYWPTAASKPNATKHDIEHADWYNRADKLVISASMEGMQKEKTVFIGHDIPAKIKEIKSKPGKNILVFGSPSAAHLLIENNLVDEYWLFVNPVILGGGIPLFPQMNQRIKLKNDFSKTFGCGVQGMHYVVADK